MPVHARDTSHAGMVSCQWDGLDGVAIERRHAERLELTGHIRPLAWAVIASSPIAPWQEHRSGARDVGGCCAVIEPGLSGALDRWHLRDAEAMVRRSTAWPVDGEQEAIERCVVKMDRVRFGSWSAVRCARAWALDPTLLYLAGSDSTRSHPIQARIWSFQHLPGSETSPGRQNLTLTGTKRTSAVADPDRLNRRASRRAGSPWPRVFRLSQIVTSRRLKASTAFGRSTNVTRSIPVSPRR